MNSDMVKSIVTSIALWGLGAVAIKFGLDADTMATIAAGVAAVAVVVFKAVQHK